MVCQPHQHQHAPRLPAQDIADFMAFAGLRQPEQFRDITRAHVIAWRELAALSSLYAYLCDRNAVLHNPVLGVKRPRSMNREGVTPRSAITRRACCWMPRQRAR